MLLRERALEAIELLPQAPRELADTIRAIGSAGQLADMVASTMDISPSEKEEVLETFDLARRIDRVLEFLNQRLGVLRLSRELGEATRGTLEKRQREALLREQLATIRKELGEDEGTAAEVEDLKKAIVESGMPEEVLQQANKELRRLERMPEAAAEHGMLRSYLDTLIELPWAKSTEDRIDVAEAQRVLDEDHYDLEKIKKRIVEFLAVHKLAPEGRSPILCFVGPPGVGKTSLGQSIARAMGRKFARVSLGGVHDESEIRGHRRTYVGALPGNIIQAIRKVGVNNPVMMLDEMDKLGTGFHGDPSAALLEVLDPEQNSTFRDAYLAVPFDLSRVLFIGTANMLDTIPGPLARPDGGDRAALLHRGREGRHRPALPDGPPAQGHRPHAGAGRDHRRCPAPSGPRLHARGRRAQPGAHRRRRAALGGGAGGGRPCREDHRRYRRT